MNLPVTEVDFQPFIATTCPFSISSMAFSIISASEGGFEGYATKQLILDAILLPPVLQTSVMSHAFYVSNYTLPQDHNSRQNKKSVSISVIRGLHYPKFSNPSNPN